MAYAPSTAPGPASGGAPVPNTRTLGAVQMLMHLAQPQQTQPGAGA
jgi:hypothetical protein